MDYLQLIFQVFIYRTCAVRYKIVESKVGILLYCLHYTRNSSFYGIVNNNLTYHLTIRR